MECPDPCVGGGVGGWGCGGTDHFWNYSHIVDIMADRMHVHLQLTMEQENKKLKNQLQSLNQQLNESEAVQKDFVCLSQSLQVRHSLHSVL